MSADIPATATGCTDVLQKLNLQDWQIGRGKVPMINYRSIAAIIDDRSIE